MHWLGGWLRRRAAVPVDSCGTGTNTGDSLRAACLIDLKRINEMAAKNRDVLMGYTGNTVKVVVAMLYSPICWIRDFLVSIPLIMNTSLGVG